MPRRGSRAADDCLAARHPPEPRARQPGTAHVWSDGPAPAPTWVRGAWRRGGDRGGCRSTRRPARTCPARNRTTRRDFGWTKRAYCRACAPCCTSSRTIKGVVPEIRADQCCRDPDIADGSRETRAFQAQVGEPPMTKISLPAVEQRARRAGLADVEVMSCWPMGECKNVHSWTGGARPCPGRGTQAMPQCWRPTAEIQPSLVLWSRPP